MSDELQEIQEIVTEKDEVNFIASTGRKIPTKKFSPLLLEKIRNSVDMPAPPTYVVKTISGVEEIHEHTESTLDGPEDVEAWQKYQEDLREAQAELTRKMMNLILVKGVDVDLPDDDSWMEEQELVGIEIPKDNRAKLRLHYIETELVQGTDDLTNLMTFVMERIGVKREVIEDAEKSFQDNVPEQADRGNVETAEVQDDGGLGNGRRYEIIESRMEL